MSDSKNQQPYFPHYGNARNEDRLIRLRMKHGAAGYGVYYMLLERLRLSEGFKCSMDYEVLCWDLRCEEELIKSVINDFGLFMIVDDGTKFQSIELNDYMKFMEEKKRKRTESARAAANARWGNQTLTDQELSKDNAAADSQATPAVIKNQKQSLQDELYIMANDAEWLNAIAGESGHTTEEILSYFPDFKRRCISGGRVNGHTDIIDAKNHFRSWMDKTGKFFKPLKESSKEKKAQTSRMKELDRQQKERDQNYREQEKNVMSPEDYIRNKGYDPEKVTMQNVMNPNWTANNLPSHPEWIGKFGNKAKHSVKEECPLPY